MKFLEIEVSYCVGFQEDALVTSFQFRILNLHSVLNQSVHAYVYCMYENIYSNLVNAANLGKVFDFNH